MNEKNTLARRFASHLPPAIQQSIRRYQYARQIRKGTFVTTEPEYEMLSQWIGDGSCALDIGANIGHYTCRMSSIVGDTGLVVALEPVPTTFELLVSNSRHFTHSNVALVNAAASSNSGLVGMSVPTFDSGLSNYYMAEISNTDHDVLVQSLTIDSLHIDRSVSLIKVDVEGHELSVLQGTVELLQRDKPTLIVEGFDDEVDKLLRGFGYSPTTIDGSPNTIYRR